jgi:hypothetical protein
MKKLPGVLIICTFFCCCTNQDKKDSSIIPEKQMTDVMWDLVRVDQFVQDLVAKDSTKNKSEESKRMYDQVFRLHHITAEQFKKSQNWYESSPVRFRPIIDSLAKKQVVEKPQLKPIGADTSFERAKHPKLLKKE